LFKNQSGHRQQENNQKAFIGSPIFLSASLNLQNQKQSTATQPKIRFNPAFDLEKHLQQISWHQ